MPKKKKSQKSDLGKIVQLLAVIGGLITILYGVLAIIGGALSLFVFNIGGVPILVQGIIIIVVGFIVIASYGLVKSKFAVKMNWLILFILGLIAYVFGGGIGALLIIIAAIIEIFRVLT